MKDLKEMFKTLYPKSTQGWLFLNEETFEYQIRGFGAIEVINISTELHPKTIRVNNSLPNGSYEKCNTFCRFAEGMGYTVIKHYGSY